MPTGETQRIPAGDYWNQSGAVWVFSTDTAGIQFGFAAIPGEGAPGASIPQAAADAIKIDSKDSAWTLSVPSPSVGEYDIVFGIGIPSTKAPAATTTRATWLSGACSVTTFLDPSTTLDCVSTKITPDSATACACPDNKIYERLSGGDSPCGDYIGADSNLLEAIFLSCPSIDGGPATTTPGPAIGSTAADTSLAIITSQVSSTVAPRAKMIKRKASFVSPLPQGSRPNDALNESNVKRANPAAGQYNLTIIGTYPCADQPGLGLQPRPTQSGTSDPRIITACAQNAIQTDASAWVEYGANSYLSSILSAAARTPIAPQVDAGVLLQKDTGQSSDCQYDKPCAPIVCKDVSDSDFGNELLAQRFLGYTAYINFSNFFYDIWNALFNSGVLGVGSIDPIVGTFFDDPTPEATWEQILGLFTPLISILSTVLGPLGGIATAMGGVVNEAIGSGTIADLKPVIDQRYSESIKISTFVTDYLKAVSSGVQVAYQNVIGNATAVQWCGSTYGDPNGYFGTGYWVDSDPMDGFQTNLYTNFLKTLSYKSINYAWNDSNAFIIFVPYDVQVADTNGKMRTVDETYCRTLQTSDQEKVLTVCDGMDGMARIFNANGGVFPMSTTPMGWDSNFEIMSGVKFDTSAAIRGSVASWKAGDFNYDIGDHFGDSLTKAGTSGSLDESIATAIGKLIIAEETAGFFNIPVCRTGGMAGSTAMFSKNVNSKVMEMCTPTPIVTPESPYTYDVCSQQLYAGPGT
ncbi:hypothetical protein MMC21_000352 [Puttea exsequens]|nr:hypothetical protein [Puttea exsequens]